MHSRFESRKGLKDGCLQSEEIAGREKDGSGCRSEVAEKTSKQTCDCDIFSIETLKAFLNGPLYMDAPLLMELAAGNCPPSQLIMMAII